MSNNNGPKIDVTEPGPTVVPLDAVVQVNIVHNFATGENRVQFTGNRMDLVFGALRTAENTLMANQLKGDESRIVRPAGPIPTPRGRG